MKMYKKGGILAVALAIVMVFAAVAIAPSDVDSAPTYSENNTVATVGTAEDFATTLANASVTKIVLSADITLGATTINKTITIDGNKHTITLNGDITVTAASETHTVTFKNMTITNAEGSTDYQIELPETSADKAELIIDNCTFTGTVTGVDDRTMFIADGNATISNSNFNGKKVTISYAADHVTFQNDSKVYLNFGKAVTLDSETVQGQVSIDSSTSITEIRITNGLDLNGNTIVTDAIHVSTSTATISNGTIDADITLYSGTGGAVSTTVTVSDVILKGDNVLSSGVDITVDTGKTFEIDGQVKLNGNVINSSAGTFINNNTAPGANLIPNTGNASGEGWSFDTTEDGTLTLNGYDGSNIFKGTFKTLILVGDNTITLDADSAIIAIESTSLTDIKTRATGNGSLTIEITGDFAESAIKSNAELTVNGVTLNISVVNTKEDYNTTTTAAINGGTTSLDILFADVSISMEDANGLLNGLKTADLTITKSTLDVSAPSKAIDATVSTIAESTIKAVSEGDAFTTTSTISNKSVIDVKSMKGYGLVGGFSIEQGSALTASGLYIKANTENYATVTNNGAMVIEKMFKFTNYASFTNNGTIGIYGLFYNAGGETVNDGQINTYGYDKGTGQNSIIIKNSDNTKNVTMNIDINGIKADGTMDVTVTITAVTPAAEGAIAPVKGTMTVSKYGISIKAVDENTSVSISVTYSKTILEAAAADIEKYTVTVSTNSFKETEKSVDTANNTEIFKFLSLVDAPVGQTISVTDGKLTNNGSISTKTAQTTLIDGGELVNAGTITADDAITMKSGKLSGNAITLGQGVTVDLTGEVDTSFDYAGEYTYKKDGKDVKVTYDNQLKVVGFCDGVKFSTNEEAEDDEDSATFEIKNSAAQEDKDVKITLVKGTVFAKDDSLAFILGGTEKGVTVEVLAGATFQARGAIDVGAGVLAIQDGAVLNIQGEDVETYGFGKLTYVISFAKDGYTYYGNLAYALANATEGMKLILSTPTEITDDLVVGKGITLEFAKKATLALGTDTAGKVIKVSMLEGASFVFTDKTNAVTIQNNGAVVSGTFVYGGNVVILDKVTLVDATDKIAPVEATKTDASAISFVNDTDDMKDGTVTASAGKVKLQTSFGQNETKKTASKLVISEGASVVETGNGVVLGAGASVIIDGTLTISKDETTITAQVSGNGNIVIADSKDVTFDGTKSQKITVTNKDATDKVVLDGMTVNKTGNANELTITSYAKSGTKAAYLDIKGQYYSGTIQIVGNGSISTLAVDSKAILDVPAGSTVTVLADSKAKGLVKVAGTINMKVDGDASTVSYSALDYDITYTDGDYTVYTVVTTAVSNASAGDSFTLTKDLEISDKLEVPSGVTIIVPSDYKIILENGEYIILGTGITTIGATGGIQGTVQIADGAYIIEFNDATMDNSGMKIVGSTTSTKIVNSQVTVLNQLYATIYAVKDTVEIGNYETTGSVASLVIPEIEGYRFVKFVNPVNQPITTEKVGATDIIANMLASQVQVVFQKVDGITYYVNNVKQNTVGAPVYVAYGSTVTAVADYGYSGTPLVNGKSYITVNNDTTTIVGSGVSPTEPEPTPEPEQKDDGMGITDYLLIVLVVLAAILVVIVAIRMMRS